MLNKKIPRTTYSFSGSSYTRQNQTIKRSHNVPQQSFAHIKRNKHHNSSSKLNLLSSNQIENADVQTSPTFRQFTIYYCIGIQSVRSHAVVNHASRASNIFLSIKLRIFISNTHASTQFSTHLNHVAPKTIHYCIKNFTSHNRTETIKFCM